MTDNYTVLARKYRPKNFSEVVGQEHVLDAMRNSILNKKLHSVYLLSGTRGVGKTTIARIFTKAMNCENFKEHLEPCGKCSSCQSIDEGASPDLLEVDAASRTKVEETKEIIDNIQFAPLLSKYKVFIIDEVHMLSVSSFNALLKTLEEPPEYAKFILCTTDPQKIPATVLSRCLHFHLKPFTEDQIANQLKSILEKELISFDTKAIKALALAANGSMRDCLSLADQAIAIGNQEVSAKSVYQMLGLVDDTLPTDLVIGILRGQKYEVLSILQRINQEQADWESVVNQILNIFYQASIIPFLSPDLYLSHGIDNEALIAEYQRKNYILFEVDKTQVAYETFTHALEMLKVTANPYQVVQLASIRALAFANQGNISVLKSSQTAIRREIISSPAPTTRTNPYKKVNSTLDDQSEFSLTKNQLMFGTKAEQGESAEKILSGMVVYCEDKSQEAELDGLPAELRKSLIIRKKVASAPKPAPASAPAQEAVPENKGEQVLPESSLAPLDSAQEEIVYNPETELVSSEQINKLISQEQSNLPPESAPEQLQTSLDFTSLTSDEIAILQPSIDITVDTDDLRIDLSQHENIREVNLLGAYRTKATFMQHIDEQLERLALSSDIWEASFAYCMQNEQLGQSLAYEQWGYISLESLVGETISRAQENPYIKQVFSLDLNKTSLIFISSLTCGLIGLDSSSPTLLIDFQGNQDIETEFNHKHKQALMQSLDKAGIEFTTVATADYTTFKINKLITEIIQQSILFIQAEQSKTLSLFK